MAKQASQELRSILSTALRAVDDPRYAERERLERKIAGYRHDTIDVAVRLGEHSSRATLAALDYARHKIPTSLDVVALQMAAVIMVSTRLMLMAGDIAAMKMRLEEISR